MIIPNPNNGTFILKTTRGGDLKIVNSLGQTVCELLAEAGAENEVDLSNLSPGVYFVVGKMNGTVSSEKILVFGN